MMVLYQESRCPEFRKPHRALKRINAAYAVCDELWQILFVVARGYANPLLSGTTAVLHHPSRGIGIEYASAAIGSQKRPCKSVDARLLDFDGHGPFESEATFEIEVRRVRGFSYQNRS